MLILGWGNAGDSNLVVSKGSMQMQQLDLLGLVCNLFYLNYAEEYEDDFNGSGSWSLPRLGQCAGCVTRAKLEN